MSHICLENVLLCTQREQYCTFRVHFGKCDPWKNLNVGYLRCRLVSESGAFCSAVLCCPPAPCGAFGRSLAGDKSVRLLSRDSFRVRFFLTAPNIPVQMFVTGTSPGPRVAVTTWDSHPITTRNPFTRVPGGCGPLPQTYAII